MKLKVWLFSFFVLSSILYAKNISLDAMWETEKYVDGNDLPYSTFSIDLIVDEQKNVNGSYCYITRWGNRIDCDNPLIGTMNNHEIIVDFNSSFGGKNGKAQIIFDQNCSLKWHLVQIPDGEAYIPKESLLKLSKITRNTIMNCMGNDKFALIKTKQYLYKSPNKTSKTKMYLIKGDQVEVLEEKDNWLHILYHGKRDIKAWVPKSAVEK